jgi:hypothetical protein
LPRQIDIDKVSDEEIQDIVMTANLTPRRSALFLKLLFARRGFFLQWRRARQTGPAEFAIVRRRPQQSAGFWIPFPACAATSLTAASAVGPAVIDQIAGRIGPRKLL